MSSVIEVVALALQRQSDLKFMIARRGPGQNGAGDWEFPGGKIEPQETQTESLIREINEEFAFQLDEQKLVFVGTREHNYPERVIRLHLWRALIAVEPVFVLSEHDQVTWCYPQEMQGYPMSAADIPFIEKLI
ncbi:MAG: hypothetical protein A2622_10680 [Bdellovibrionales bacterium RIFCSPHIGHO2_01_FULL_40_29]|nr:MAG: hypothetical protein A2622_10680 [Bdellovibrionales bacterium RIFCSPHIGHO2_01_FULL_40_29]OFZ34422.1 MAG: hypothetical protein A3D17_00945 [Bdellovibrionales bacterium RIFCSPHIGHO2_02_FULL_40_15]